MAGHLRGADTESGKAAIDQLAEELWFFHMTQLLPLYVGVRPVEDALDWKKTPPLGREKFVIGVLATLEEIANDHGVDVWL